MLLVFVHVRHACRNAYIIMVSSYGTPVTKRMGRVRRTTAVPQKRMSDGCLI
ncbi:MAG: hypothetical protein IJY03_03480 [Prevotella sp.]|nr:hypothetical protein [Prevotella sp.]